MLQLLHYNKFPFYRLLILFLLVSGVLSYIFYPTDYSMGGDRARYATCQSLVERGTFCIDDAAGFDTIDKVYIQGHFYGCQTPLMPMIMTLIYYPLFLLNLNYDQHYNLLAWLFSLIFAGGSAAGAALILGKIALQETASLKKAVNIALLFFFCTLYLPYSVFLNNHVFGGFLVLLGFYLIAYCSAKHIHLLLAGFALAAAAVTDPPIGITAGCALFTYMIYQGRPLRQFLLFCAGGIVPAAAHILANLSISGSVLPVNVKPEFFDYPGTKFDATNLSGVVANTTLPEITRYAFHSLLGHRGLFSYTPILIFAVWGIVLALKNKTTCPKALITALPALLVIAFYIWRTKNYGGASYGVRFFLPVVPLIFWGLIFWQRELYSKPVRLLFAIAVIWSALFAFVGSLRTPSDEKAGLNSFVVNLFHYQSLKMPQFSHLSWKILGKISHNNPEKLTYLGYWFNALGDFKDAESVLRYSLQLQESPETLYWLGKNALLSQQYQTAVERLQRALQLNPSPIYTKPLGFAFAHLAQYDSSNYYLQYSLAAGDSIEARAPYQMTRASLVYYSADERVTILARLAENYMALGNLTQAKAYLNQISEPHYVISEVHRAQIRYLLLTGDILQAKRLIVDTVHRRPSFLICLQSDPYLAPYTEEAVQSTLRSNDDRR